MESLTWSGIWEPMNNNWAAFELKEKPVLTTTMHETMVLNNCESKHNEMWEQSETTNPAPPVLHALNNNEWAVRSEIPPYGIQNCIGS